MEGGILAAYRVRRASSKLHEQTSRHGTASTCSPSTAVATVPERSDISIAGP